MREVASSINPRKCIRGRDMGERGCACQFKMISPKGKKTMKPKRKNVSKRKWNYKSHDYEEEQNFVHQDLREQ